MTLGVFLLVLLGAIQASLYTVERITAVTAVADGARVAAGGGPGLAGVSSPDINDAAGAVARLAAPLLFGTRVVALPSGGPCPALDAIPAGEVDTCATQDGMTVTVSLRGWPATLAPPVLGLRWPLDIAAEAHAVTFAP